MKNLLFLIIGLMTVLGSIFLYFRQPIESENQIKIIKINDVSLAVEIVDTPEARVKGLSDRETLPDGTGMLFVFENPAQYGFWMKDMNFAIDIVWINEELRIVGLEKDVLPDTFPQIFYPDQAVRYVLELPAGSVDTYRLDADQYVTI